MCALTVCPCKYEIMYFKEQNEKLSQLQKDLVLDENVTS